MVSINFLSNKNMMMQVTGVHALVCRGPTREIKYPGTRLRE